MSADETLPDSRLERVLRLTTQLADRVLDAQIMKRPVPEDQARALASAARLLHDHGVESPPLLTQVLHELAQEVGQGEPSRCEEIEAETNPKVAQLKRFLGVFRREKDQP